MTCDDPNGLMFAATWFLPPQTRGETSDKWRLKALGSPKGIRGALSTSAAAVTAACSDWCPHAGIGAQIARDLIGSSNSLVNGAAKASFALIIGVAAISGRWVSSRDVVVFGGIASMAGLLLIAISAAQHALPAFLGAVVAPGTGYRFLFPDGLNLINAKASAPYRGGTLSALFLITYLLQGRI